jgi:hypothetical protein
MMDALMASEIMLNVVVAVAVLLNVVAPNF